MPKREAVGSENLIGQNVVLLRRRKGMRQTVLLSQLQVRGIEIGQSALSDLEGQNRKVSDKEMVQLLMCWVSPWKNCCTQKNQKNKKLR